MNNKVYRPNDWLHWKWQRKGSHTVQAQLFPTSLLKRDFTRGWKERLSIIQPLKSQLDFFYFTLWSQKPLKRKSFSWSCSWIYKKKKKKKFFLLTVRHLHLRREIKRQGAMWEKMRRRVVFNLRHTVFTQCSGSVCEATYESLITTDWVAGNGD